MGILALLALGLGSAACDAGGAAEAGTAGTAEPLYDADGRALLLPSDDPGVLAFEQILLKLVNEHRTGFGRAPFKASALLSDAARAHGRNMVDGRYFSHESPDGGTPSHRLASAGLDWQAVGENLVAGPDFGTPQAVFDAWLASPGHRANLESDQYEFAGAGYVQDSGPTEDFPHVHFWTLVLLKP
jgi:uncharacterized protein YkwD